MRSFFVVTLAAGALLCPAVAPAQQAWTVEVGGFGRYTAFDNFRNYDDALSASGRLGLFLHPMWALEGDVSFGSASRPGDDDFDHVSWHARLLHNHPLAARVDVLLGAGVGQMDFGADAREPNPQFGHAFLGGLRWRLSERVSLRTEAAFDHMPAPYNRNVGTFTCQVQPDGNCVARIPSEDHWSFQAGVSYLFDLRRQAAPEPMPQAQQQPPPPPPPPAPMRQPEQPRPQPQPPAPAPAPAPQPPPPPPPAPRVDEAAITARATLIEPVHFDFAKDGIRGDAAEKLMQKAAVLKANPEVTVHIEGNTDARGSNDFNIKLGMKRAEAARDFLVKQGIAAGRLAVGSAGEEKPMDPAENEEAWAKNRRAEFHIMRGGERLKLPN